MSTKQKKTSAQKYGVCQECHYMKQHAACSGTKEYPCGCECARAKASTKEGTKT